MSGAFSAPANAADLGGDCCADLEERVAELEATTVRKGNRKVSVTLYGHVNKAVLFWDDGHESNTYVTDDDHNSTRFGFKGKAKISKGWSAGFKIEIEVDGGTSTAEVDANDDNPGGDPSTRHSFLWVKSKQYGKISLGHTSAATDDITHKGFIAKNTNATRPDFHYNRKFELTSNGAYTGTLIGELCGDTFDKDACFDSSSRQNVVRYDSPSMAGFTVMAAWGNDDFWDVGVRWKGKAGDFKMAATVGYRNNNMDGDNYDGGLPNGNDLEEDSVAGSAGIIHTPTGLYVQGSYRWAEVEDSDDSTTFINGRDMTAWYVQAGIQQKWTSLGKTTIYGEYTEVEDGFLGECAVDGNACQASSELTRWGVGITQAIDSAAMELYILYQNTEAETTSIANVKTEYDDFSNVVAGAIIKF